MQHFDFPSILSQVVQLVSQLPLTQTHHSVFIFRTNCHSNECIIDNKRNDTPKNGDDNITNYMNIIEWSA